MTAPEDDDPVTLQQACDIVFKGAITPWSLKAEAGRGKLEIFKVGRRQFTTLRAVRALCQGKQSPASTSTPREKLGRSAMGANPSERVSVLRSAIKLVKN